MSLDFKTLIDYWEKDIAEFKNLFNEEKKMISLLDEEMKKREDLISSKESILNRINKEIEIIELDLERINNEIKENEAMRNEIINENIDFLIINYIYPEIKKKYNDIETSVKKISLSNFNSNNKNKILKDMSNDDYISICDKLRKGYSIQYKEHQEDDFGEIFVETIKASLFATFSTLLVGFREDAKIGIFVLIIIIALLVNFPIIIAVALGLLFAYLLIRASIILIKTMSTNVNNNNYEKVASVASIFKTNKNGIIEGYYYLSKFLYEREKKKYEKALNLAINNKNEELKKEGKNINENNIDISNIEIQYKSEYKFINEINKIVNEIKCGNDDYTKNINKLKEELKDINNKKIKKQEYKENDAIKDVDYEINNINYKIDNQEEKIKLNNTKITSLINKINSEYDIDEIDIELTPIYQRSKGLNDVMVKEIFIGSNINVYDSGRYKYNLTIPCFVKTDNPFILVHDGDKEAKETTGLFYRIIDNMIPYIMTHMYNRGFKFVIIDNKMSLRIASENMNKIGGGLSELSGQGYDIVEFITGKDHTAYEKIINDKDNELNVSGASNIIDANDKEKGQNIIKYVFLCNRVYSTNDMKVDNINSLLTNCEGCGIFNFIFISKELFEENKLSFELPIKQICKNKYYETSIDKKVSKYINIKECKL